MYKPLESRNNWIYKYRKVLNPSKVCVKEKYSKEE